MAVFNECSELLVELLTPRQALDPEHALLDCTAVLAWSMVHPHPCPMDFAFDFEDARLPYLRDAYIAQQDPNLQQAKFPRHLLPGQTFRAQLVLCTAELKTLWQHEKLQRAEHNGKTTERQVRKDLLLL